MKISTLSLVLNLFPCKEAHPGLYSDLCYSPVCPGLKHSKEHNNLTSWLPLTGEFDILKDSG